MRDYFVKFAVKKLKMKMSLLLAWFPHELTKLIIPPASSQEVVKGKIKMKREREGIENTINGNKNQRKIILGIFIFKQIRWIYTSCS